MFNSLKESGMAWAITPLAQETRANVSTREAAHHLGRSPATLHAWSCGARTAPLKPVREGGRLAWPVAEIRRLLGVEVPA